jgi:germination protein M
MMLVLNACSGSETNVTIMSEGIELEFYFINQDKTQLVVETDSIEETPSQRLMVERILERLQEGPKEKTYNKSVSDGLNIKDVKIDNTTVRITFDDTYATLSYFDDVFTRAAIVKSLTQLEFVNFVEFYINDQPLKDTDGRPVGFMKSSDFVADISNNFKELQEVTLTLYFANEEGTGLKTEQIITHYNPNDALEKVIVELLIEGPQTEGLVSTIPKETMIKEIYVKDGICYIDFNEEFRSKHGGGSFGETMTIYSIVNSLAELPTINRVQFLINGQKQKEYKGHLQFDSLFERNLDFVEKEVKESK